MKKLLFIISGSISAYKSLDLLKDLIIDRFDIYKRHTLPILDFYKEKKLLHQINGMREKIEIFEEIRGIMTSLET